MRELYGMVTLGERFLHTAHEVKTARKAFLRLASFFENPRRYPELAKLVKEIRKTNGQEAIVLVNGGSVEFVARSKGSGRGFSVDVLVLDEAQELSDEAFEALLPTISASPNPQTIMTGTPPGPAANGEVFTRTRKLGVEGTDNRLAWLEWSCVGDEVDLDDRRNWAAVNPALGIRLAWETVADERQAFSDEGFGRERLGMWDDAGVGAVIDRATWAACADAASRVEDPVAFSVDVDGDGVTASIGVAGRRKDGLAHVEIVDCRPGTDWVGLRLTQLVAQWSPVSLVVNGPASAFVPELTELGVPVVVMGAAEFAAACGAFRNAVTARTVRHPDQAYFNTAVEAARKRLSGDGWVWGRRHSASDITPVVAATLALHGFMTGRPRTRAGSGRVVVL